jgi:hypothetical protein
MARAGAVPPVEMESWDQDPAISPRSASDLYADPMGEVDAYDVRDEAGVVQAESESQAWDDCDAEADYAKDGYHYDNYADPDGCHGCSEAMDADAALADDSIGQIGNTANFRERDWENAPYEFGDGTTADLREVAMGSAQAVEPQVAESSSPYEYGDGMEAEYGYSRADADFTYPEEYFYKYGYRDYNYADPDGKYGYQETSNNDEAPAESDSIGQIGNVANFRERDWENAPYEFGDGTTADLREVAMGSAQAVEPQVAESSSPYEYGDGMEGEYGYEYQYPQEEYGYSAYDEGMDTAAAPAKVDYEAEYAFDSRYEGEPGELIDYAQWKTTEDYDYADPYDYYGEDRSTLEQPSPAARPDDGQQKRPEGEKTAGRTDDSQGVESGLELFAGRPGDLLTPADQEVLQTLETLCEEPSGARRSVLNDYLEGLGFEALDFAVRFEDVTGIETLGLADDLPGTAALLGCFRLLEQGVLGMDESVDLLRRTLRRPSLDWIEGVREITAGAYEGGQAQSASVEPRRATTAVVSQSLTRVVASLLTTAWSQTQETWTGLAVRAAGWDWESWISGLEARLAAARSDSPYEAF